MMELATRKAMNARPPPTDQLQKALEKFSSFKNKSRQPINCIEVGHALGTFRHLRDTIKDDPDFGMSMKYHIFPMIKALSRYPPGDNLDLHCDFARDLFAEAQRREKARTGSDEPLSDQYIDALFYLSRVLASAGYTVEALPYVERLWKLWRSRSNDRTFESHFGNVMIRLWSLLLRGFQRENNEEELLRTFRSSELAGVPYTTAIRHVMVHFYADKDDVLATKAWYAKKCTIKASGWVSGWGSALQFKFYDIILKFCLRNNEKDWCTAVFRELIESKPEKAEWDAILLWAASAMGKGVEELEKMMAIVIRRNPDSPDIRPDTRTINRLIRMAVEQEQPYAAERYITLGKKWGIHPNAATYLLQMRYRIAAGDLTGAEVSYNLLQSHVIAPTTEKGAASVMDKFIRSLCAAKTTKHDLINTLIEDIEERKLHLTGDTVTALCLMNLHRNELNDVVNILQAHSYHLTIHERAKTREALVEFCFDRSNGTQKVWDAYTIFRYLFDEVNIEMRTRMMNEFFDRQRPDLATHVFGHMRQHPRPENRPEVSTYIAVFAGFARPGCANAKCLEIVHNMLKLDHRVEPNTKLYNSLMLAYTAVEDPRRALRFWEDITNSIEGPTYSSIEIVFRACEILPFGFRPANNIWNKMKSMEIEVTPPVFAAYIGALAASALEKECKELIEGMETTVGFGPDVAT